MRTDISRDARVRQIALQHEPDIFPREPAAEFADEERAGMHVGLLPVFLKRRRM